MRTFQLQRRTRFTLASAVVLVGGVLLLALLAFGQAQAGASPVGDGHGSAPVISNLPTFGRAGLGFVAQVSADSHGKTSVVSSTPNVCSVGSDGLSVSYLSSGTCSLTAQVTTSANCPPDKGSPQSFFISPVTGSATPTTSPIQHGYWLVGSDGGIFSFGAAQFYGSMGGTQLQRPVVGIVPTADRGGYWLDASDGGVFSFGDTQFYGSIPGLGLHPAGSGLPHSLNAPIVGMVPSHDQAGYFMVASDGGVFAFGDATFAGSCPGIGGCAGKAVSVIPDNSGKGYWLVTTTGNVYGFGDAANLGAPGQQSSPITSAVATPDGKGYWILESNGQVFTYGDATNYGSPAAATFGGFNVASTVFATSDGAGYWVADGKGQVFPFGDAPMDGDMSGTQLNGPIIGASGS